MRFAILDNGYLKTDINNVVAGARIRTKSNPDAVSEFYNLPVMSVLIESDGDYILYDTGCHMNSMKDRWPDGIKDGYELHQKIEQNLEIQLASCGVRKEQIKTVIISHMHFDHTGNIEMFKSADIYVPKTDFMLGQTTVHLTDDPTNYYGYCKKDLEIPVRQYHLVDDEFEIAPGVEIINLPGHTPNLLGLVLHTEKSGTFIFPMDAVYIGEIYSQPTKLCGLLYNREDYLESIEKLRRLEKKYNAKVIPGHDFEIFQSLKKAPNWYE